MRASVGLIVIVLIVMTAEHACWAASVAELEGVSKIMKRIELSISLPENLNLLILLAIRVQKAPSYHYKRSLCNTFGGCGAKRSLPAPPGYFGVINTPDGSSDKESLVQQQNKRDQNLPYLANEIPGELMASPDISSRYRQPVKFVVLVPKQPAYDGNNVGPINQASVEPADIQELRVGRIFLNRNE